MKILHLLNSNRFSGAENVVCQIIHMMKDVPEIEMVYCSPDGQIRDALAERNVPFLALKALSVSEVKRAIREYQPDLIHAHDMRACFVAACVCGKIPIISHIHNNNFDSRAVSFKSILYLLAGIKSKHIFWVSQGSYNGYIFHSFFRNKSEVLYNILDIDALLDKAKSDPRHYEYDVVYLGRLTGLKDPLRTIRVFADVVKAVPQARMAVIGSGDLEKETKMLCQELGLNNQIDFLGFQSNPLQIVQSAKVMLMTSLTEGTPMSALEALALGTPIVSTPVGGMCELIANEQNGFLSDDDPVLKERIIQIITNSTLQKSLSEQAIEKAKETNDITAYRDKLVRQYRCKE